MPVEVSLELLVAVRGSRPAWPAEFRQLVEAAEADTDERTVFGALADWCDAQGEAGLARGFRWLMRRPGVKLHVHRTSNWDGVSTTFRLLDSAAMPQAVWDAPGLPGGVDDSLAAVVADLAARLRFLDAVLE
jgi:hypothetical protein